MWKLRLRDIPEIMVVLQAFFRDIVGFVPEHCNKANIIIKQVTHFFFVSLPVYLNVFYTIL